MKITLSPQFSEKKIAVSKKGDTLTINGISVDFTQLPEGAFLPAEAINVDSILGGVTRDSEGLNLTLIIPVTLDASKEALFPEMLVNPPDGKLKFPKGTNV